MEQEFMGEAKPRGNGLSIAALVLGILSVLCCCVGFPFAIIGIILAVIALVKNQRAKPAAIIGLILSVICMVITVVSTVKIKPYSDELSEFSKNIDEYVEKYDETGEIPPVFEKMQKKENMTDDEIKQVMDFLSDIYKKSQEKTDSSSDANLSSKTNR